MGGASGAPRLLGIYLISKMHTKTIQKIQKAYIKTHEKDVKMYKDIENSQGTLLLQKCRPLKDLMSLSLNCSLWSSQPQVYTGLPYTPLRGPVGVTQRGPPVGVGLQELKSPGVLWVSIAQLGPEAIRVWRQAALFLGWRPGGTGEWLTLSVALYVTMQPYHCTLGSLVRCMRIHAGPSLLTLRVQRRIDSSTLFLFLSGAAVYWVLVPCAKKAQ